MYKENILSSAPLSLISSPPVGSRQTWFLPPVFVTLLRDHYLLISPAMQSLLASGPHKEVQISVVDVAELAAAADMSLKQCLAAVWRDHSKGEKPYGVFKIKRSLLKLAPAS
jgi:hypothetical protein